MEWIFNFQTRKIKVLSLQLQIMYYFCRPKTTRNESNLDNHSTDSLKHIYDLCMVWSSKTSRNENLLKLALNFGDTIFLGRSISWILRTGPCKQNRIHWKRRSVQPHATQSNTRSHITDSIHTYSNVHVQGPKLTVEPYCSIFMPHYGSIFRFFEIIFKKHIKIFGG